MAGGGRLGDIIKMDEELIMKTCSSAMNAHKFQGNPFTFEKISDSSDTYTSFIFSFAGSWSINDWQLAQKPFGETQIKTELFPSLRSIGNDEFAMVNQAFQQRFEEQILGTSDFRAKVEMAMQKSVKGRKQMVFTGHSTGGSIAILATLWFLEKCSIREDTSPLCVTFGCPLTGNHIFSHALSREKWASYFKHFVMRYDIVPRILLAPIPSIDQKIPPILQLFDAKCKNPALQHFENIITQQASDFFITVMRNASAMTSHAACKLMGNTNFLLETTASFISLSPYKPFGTYIFCTGNGKLVVLSNPDAVLQLLFYSCQLSRETDQEVDIAYKSLLQHFVYEVELQESLQMQDVHNLDLNQLGTLPLSAEVGGDSATLNSALNDLGLSSRARLCLRAVGELEKRKLGNKDHINGKKTDIDKAMKELEDYRAKSALRKLGYYDAFKLQKDYKDFDATVKRQELAGIWDEIIEMLKRYELPDGFEGDKGWVELGTRYRRLVEPLDIANYYRQSKNEDTGAYMKRGRPKRYRYTQRWREHAGKMATDASGESNFWAELEEIHSKTGSREGFEEVKDRVLKLEEDVHKWVFGGDLDRDVFLEESTLVKWWKILPDEHKSRSCLSRFMNG
ncbi:protein EDS1L-like [Juglans microcarpa x Juglans regia]|uniref:protein EDS1L-like n=1 Tax=Juglans microcarpa x Juglans regia TaxID=2249226 RepID=UPI001B7E8FD6|nr:protein EDS1L-like [Juglans microcarpa x Juglans regia]